MKVNNIVLLGSSSFTITCFKALKAARQKVVAIIGVSTDKLPLNSIDMEKFCEDNGVLYFASSDLDSKESLVFLRKLQPDLIFSTWPFILKESAIKSARLGVIGTHPTKIPANRGRHPIHWLIDFACTSTYLSFFLMDEGVDTGNVIHQQKFSVFPGKPIDFTLKKMDQAAVIGIKKIFKTLSMGKRIPTKTQDHKDSNYLRKRSVHDSIVDLRSRGKDLQLLCNSFAPPYPGITLLWGDTAFKVTSINFKPLAKAKLQKIEHGKIIKIDSKKIFCKCRDGVVEMFLDKEIPKYLKTKKYIMPPSYYLMENFDSLKNQLK